MRRNVQSTTAIEQITQTSEYNIGHTTYTVELHFNLTCEETLEDIIERLIINDLEKAA